MNIIQGCDIIYCILSIIENLYCLVEKRIHGFLEIEEDFHEI